MNGQSRDIDSIGHTRHRMNTNKKTKQNTTQKTTKMNNTDTTTKSEVNTTQHNTENYKDEQHGHHQTIWGEHNTTQTPPTKSEVNTTQHNTEN